MKTNFHLAGIVLSSVLFTPQVLAMDQPPITSKPVTQQSVPKIEQHRRDGDNGLTIAPRLANFVVTTLGPPADYVASRLISAVPSRRSGVPEMAAWAILMLGFVQLSSAQRRRRLTMPSVLS